MKIITLDIDKKSKLNLLIIFIKILLKVKKIKKIELEESVKKGYHFTIWTKFNYNKYARYHLRSILGDDKHRLSMDIARKGFCSDTLFYKKEAYKE